MNIKVTKKEENVIIELEGRLDTTTSPQLEAVLKTILSSTNYLIFDFENLEYLASSGLRVILLAQKTMNKQGDMVIRNVNDVIMDIFEVTGFDDILTIE